MGHNFRNFMKLLKNLEKLINISFTRPLAITYTLTYRESLWNLNKEL